MHLPCPACGYNLVGVPHEPGKDARLRCPECGETASLHDIEHPAKSPLPEHLMILLCCACSLAAYFLLASTIYSMPYGWRVIGEPFPWEHLLWITPYVAIVTLPWVLAFTSLRKAISKPWQWAIYTMYLVIVLAFFGLVFRAISH